jgi:predicted SprT family Zn-dependent metalloprotease
VLNLSPCLEDIAWDIVVVTVAHELAHIALGHPMHSSEADEDAAWQLVTDSGFERQVNKSRRLHKWREAYEKTMTEK